MKTQRGFTLIELLLVVAIIGIISAIAIPALFGARTNARNKATASNATNISGALQTAFSIAELPNLERTATDLTIAGGLATDPPTATQVRTQVFARAEFNNMKNPFTNNTAAYLITAPVVPGDVGVVIGTVNGETVATISYMIKTNTGTSTITLPKSPETSLVQ